MTYENVECKRCGAQWYSNKFDQKGELPERCTNCYQESARKIPPPPTKLDIVEEKIRYKLNQLPKIIAERKHQMVLWKEQNKFLISLISTGIIILLIVLGLVYALFFL